MFKGESAENLDENKDQKKYTEMSDDEKMEFEKEKERELEEFKRSLVKYGIPVKGTETEIKTEKGFKGVEFSFEEEDGELKLIIKQECGKGIAGLGFYRKIWICLGQEREIKEDGNCVIKDIINEYASDANTNISLESDFQGVEFEKIEEGKIKVQIDSDHPAFAMAKLLGGKEVQLHGRYNDWKGGDPFKLNEIGKWEVVLDWNGDKSQFKIVIRDTEEKEGKIVTKPMKIDWNGEFGENANQEMKIILEPEQELDE